MSLPPLPKSLSGIELTQQQLLIQQQQLNQANYQNLLQLQQAQGHLSAFDSQRSLSSSSSSSIRSKTNSSLDTQLMKLKREMYSLRQLDLSLLSQLWSLNESIQEYRTLLQEQENNLSPHSPTPSNSDDDAKDESETLATKTKDIENDIIEDMHQKLEKQIRKMNIAPPPVPNRKKVQQIPSTNV
jgi:hypothetical protein